MWRGGKEMCVKGYVDARPYNAVQHKKNNSIQCITKHKIQHNENNTIQYKTNIVMMAKNPENPGHTAMKSL